MTFKELQDALNDNLEGSQFTNLTDDMRKNWINQALRWVCEGQVIVTDQFGKTMMIQHDFSFLCCEAQASTVNEQRKYALPDGSVTGVLEFRKDKNIELVNSQDYRVPLTKVLKKDIEDDTSFSYLLGKGIPSHFCIEQYDIWLYKLPDHSCNEATAWTINMEYYGYLPALSADGDTNIITLKNPEVLEWKSTELGFNWAKDTDGVEIYGNRATKRLLEIINNNQAIKLGALERGCQPVDGQSLGV